MSALEVLPTKTAKHQIYQRPLMKERIIPNHPSISVFSGSQGSGKSTLVLHLLKNKLMYKKYFDAVFLLIGSDDDMYDSIIENDKETPSRPILKAKDAVIKANHVVKLPTPADIQLIIDNQKLAIEQAEDISKAPKILVIMDDLANNAALLRSPAFLQLFVAGRHLNSSTWFLSQYLNLVPKSARLQANFLFVFKSNRAEMEVLYGQFCPPDMNKKEFFDMVLKTTADSKNTKGDRKVNFLLIVKGCPEHERFRRNLDQFIILPGHENLHKAKPPIEASLDSSDEEEMEQQRKEAQKLAPSGAPNAMSANTTPNTTITPAIQPIQPISKHSSKAPFIMRR